MSDNSLIGVNVSAEEVGKSIINLEVVSSRGKVVGTAEEYVNVNNRYDIDLPSVISKNPYTTS